MQIPPNRAAVLTENLTSLLAKIASATNKAIRLVAVSESRRQLTSSLFTPLLQAYPFWRKLFAGTHLQSFPSPSKHKLALHRGVADERCKPIAEQIPNLWCVESVDTSKKADQLEKVCGREGRGLKEVQLQVFVQVICASREAEKAGVELRETSSLYKYIIQNCSHLKLQGLMTIGAIARSEAIAEGHENEEFVGLKKAKELGIELELSIDFERSGLGRGFASSTPVHENGLKPNRTRLTFPSSDPKPHKSKLSWRLYV